MMNDDLFVKLLYEKRLPKVYREYDKKQAQSALKRYLQSLVEGGYSVALDDINKLLNYIDPEKCPAEFIPLFLQSFGLPYYPDIELKYQRRILANVGALNARRGLYAGVRFLAKVLSGMECDLEYFRGTYLKQDGRFLIVTLLAMTTEQIAEMDMGVKLMNRYIKEFLPYYIHVIIRAYIATQSIRMSMLRQHAHTQHSWGDLQSYKRLAENPSMSYIRVPVYTQKTWYDLRADIDDLGKKTNEPDMLLYLFNDYNQGV